ncbi:hypothetical protein WA026_010681 [Henosepilachna vigintioctopunctata]|uniref:Uncharacterized protein n=1 Tax=Henosepilachna vigintioctopunctata TaxID=420089 RepID=A0AAW1UWE9_9CUCU
MANLNLHSISSSNKIRRELAHGEDYRAFKNIKDGVLQPVRSPIDVSIFVQRKRYVRKVEEDIKLSRSALGSKRGSNSTSKQGKSKSVPHIKHSFWERAKLTHKQYTDILSTPHLHGCGDIPGLKKMKPQALPTICSPRLAQMAHPSKRRILSVWQDHEQSLPVEALQRLHDMLYTTLNIDMKEARNFFKLCDKKKRKLERKLKQKKKKKRDQKETIWLKNQLEQTSSAILNHFAEQPNLDTNFKQLLLSDVLLSVLGKLTEKKQPLSRYSSNLYDKELVKLVDKIAVWTENVSNIVDIQSLEEEEEEDKAEDQKEISKISEESLSLISSISLGEEPHPDEQSKPGEAGEPGVEGEGTAAELEKVSSLQRLIQILAQASSAYLANHAGYEDLTRNELLHRLKILNRQYVDASPSDIMKSILLDWAMHSAPDQVDSEIIRKIEKMSDLLAAMIDAEEIYGMNIKPDETVGEAAKDGEPGSIPGTTKPTEQEATKKPSDLPKVTEAGEGQPEPGTLTEIKAPDGTVQMGVVDENGEVTPVQLTPSGNLIPTVYDKNAKVVNQVFDKEGNLLDSTFNKFGVPEPDKYNGPLFDDEKKPHELIYNSKGKIIPQCYDKDGNPIAADYDSDGNPIQYGEDGQPVPAEQGDSTEKDKQDQSKPSEKGPEEPAAESQPESETKTEEKVEEKAETPKDKDDQPSSTEEKAEIKKEEAPDSKEKEKPPEVVDTSKEDKKGEDNPPTAGEKEPAPESPAQEGEKPKEAKEIPPEKDVKEEDKKTEGASDTQGQSPEEDKKASEANVEKDPKEELGKDEQKEEIKEKEGDEKVTAEGDKGIEEQKVETTPDDKKQTEEQKEIEEAPGETEKTPEEEETKQKEIDEDVGDEEGEGEEEGEEEEEEEEEGEGEEEGEEEEGEGEEGEVEEPQGEEPPGEEQPEEEPVEAGALIEEEESLGKLEVGDKIPGVKEKGVTIIRGHTPRRIQEHSKDTVCCLSLKIWAVWLLEITHNAHNWTKWITNIISQIREFAAILRGEILLPNGQKKIIFKEDWNKFINDMNEDVIAWRQYSRHINDLTQKIIEKFHGKKIYCCEKCLQDHLIKNVVAAHDTMRALTEALNCTGYWQRCLDEIVQATSKLFTAVPPADEYSSESETGWSYSTSSDDDYDENISYMFKNIETMPLSFWKQPESTPCRCQGQVKQLFPRSPQADVNYTKSFSFGQIDKNIPSKY